MRYYQLVKLGTLRSPSSGQTIAASFTVGIGIASVASDRKGLAPIIASLALIFALVVIYFNVASPFSCQGAEGKEGQGGNSSENCCGLHIELSVV